MTYGNYHIGFFNWGGFLGEKLEGGLEDKQERKKTERDSRGGVGSLVLCSPGRGDLKPGGNG